MPQPKILFAPFAGCKMFINLLNNINALLNLRVMRLMFLCHLNQFSFSRQFFKSPMSSLKKIRRLGAELIYEDRQEDVFDTVICAFRYLYECAQKLVKCNHNDRVRKFHVAVFLMLRHQVRRYVLRLG